MPRTARASVGGLCYHVINRGNGRAEVFHKARDNQALKLPRRDARRDDAAMSQLSFFDFARSLTLSR